MKISWRHAFLTLFVVICGYLLYSTYGEVRQQTLDGATERQFVHARQAARGIEEFFGYHISALDYLAGLESVREMDARGKELLQAFNDNSEDVQALTRVDAAGRIVHTVPFNERAIGADISHQDHVREIMANHRPVVSDVFRAVQGYLTVALHVPVLRDGEYHGSLAMLVPFDVLAHKFLEDVKIGESGHAWLVSRGGVELYCKNPDHIGKRAKTSLGDSTRKQLTTAMARGEHGTATLLGTGHREDGTGAARYHVSYTPIHIGDTTWSIAVATAEEEILATARVFRSRWLLVAAVLAVGFILYVYFTVKALAVVRRERERQQAEEILRTSNETLLTVLESIDADVYVSDMDTHEILFLNRRMKDRFGDDLIGKTCWQVFRGGDGPCEHCTNHQLLDESGHPTDALVWEGHNPLVDRWYLNHDRAIRWTDGRVVRLQLATDITERKAAEAQLQFQNSLLEAQNEASIDGILVANSDGKILFSNRRFAEMWRIPDLVLEPGNDGRALDPVVEQLQDPEGFLAGVRHLYSQPEEQRRDEILFKDGRVFDRFTAPVQTDAGQHLGRLFIFRDITEQRRQGEERRAFEAKMQHAQKLESLGILAGGIAHDFNNLLMGIMGHAELATGSLPESSEVRDHIQKIQISAGRATELTNQMLAYSGRGRFVVEPIDINTLVKEMGELLETVIAKKAELHVELLGGLPAVKADASQLRQVVMNLITNASEALGDGPGQIRLATGTVDATTEDLHSEYMEEEPLPGPYVWIEVRDTGSGMAPEVSRKLFDPFFTTKFTGRGLGLAAVLGIIRGHQGTIHVDSVPGEGTSVQVLLPATEKVPVPPRDTDATHQDAHAVSGATILVVDDEDSVRDVISGILGQADVRVLEASDGREAVEVFRARGEDIDLVLLDMTMPAMGGPETFEALRELRPSVPVILCSGFDQHDAARSFPDAKPAAFLQKPYRAATLLTTIGEILGAR